MDKMRYALSIFLDHKEEIYNDGEKISVEKSVRYVLIDDSKIDNKIS